MSGDHPADGGPWAPSRMQQPGGDLAAHGAFPDLAAAAEAVFEQLRTWTGFRFWAISRVIGGTYVVLSTGDSGFPAPIGEQLAWVDTLCYQVLSGRVPRICPDVHAVAAYNDIPLIREWKVASYLSTPLTLDGTALFGTLCALDRTPRPLAIATQLPLVDLQARLLSTVLAAEMDADQARREGERARADALLDPLTGLVNRRGWQVLLDQEEQRCRRYGAIASVLVIDLDGLKTVNDSNGHAAGDSLLQHAANVLRSAFRSADIVARLGGDEFAVLAVETDQAAVQQGRHRLQALFAAAGVPASIGVASSAPTIPLSAAWADADIDMYRAKQTRPRPPTH